MVRTRFAPSPTGYLHIGGARTALFCWLYARRYGGQFVLRIEDTDLARSTPASIQAILDAMDWLGLDYDEGPFYQTERFQRYREVAERLLAEGKAYRCYCTPQELDELRAEQRAKQQKPRYDGRYRDYDGPPRDGVEPVIRFKNPLDGDVTFDDFIRGRISVNNRELDDLVILRPDGSPTYNFCVVVDDLDMQIQQVIRGDDHINNTPRQINIFRALGAEPPRYGHVPMILGADGARLSKRHGAVSVMQYRDDGVLPEALLNYLVRLGWSHGDQELFTRDEMTALFSLDDVNRAPSTFNPDKLAWVNQQYLQNATDYRRMGGLLAEHLTRLGINPEAGDGPPPARAFAAFKERGKTLREIAENCAFLYRDALDYGGKAARKALSGDAAGPLAALRDDLAALGESDWREEPLGQTLQQTAERLGVKFGKLGQPLRAAVTGGSPSPGLDQTLALLGRDKTLTRIDSALTHISAAAGA